jgi:SAM-dependent methyltransferase
MYRREDAHWWYSGMRKAALALLRSRLDQPEAGRRPRVLDAGCGTGGTTARLAEFGAVYGVDYSPEALERAARRGLSSRLAQGSIERLPYQDGAFDLVTSFEVVYHAGVADDALAFAELRRVLRPGGLLLLRLPGHDWLRGAHDKLVFTRHRYSRGEVGAKLRRAGFALAYLSWANTVLFPPAAAKRLLEGLTAGPEDAAAEPDLWQPPAALNWFLEQCLAVESLAFERRIRLPFGLSVIALARAV